MLLSSSKNKKIHLTISFALLQVQRDTAWQSLVVAFVVVCARGSPVSPAQLVGVIDFFKLNCDGSHLWLQQHFGSLVS